MNHQLYPANQMIIKLLLEHAVLKTSLATWLGVSTRAVDSILLGNEITPSLYKKLVTVYHRFESAL